MASRTPALELRNVSYVGNGKTILHSINWTVRQGDHWALLGPNGSGKTTRQPAVLAFSHFVQGFTR